MQDQELSEFMETLGLGKNASPSEIEEAHKRLNAFFSCDGDECASIKNLADRISAKVSFSQSSLSKPAFKQSTTSGVNVAAAQPKIAPKEESQKESKSGLYWALGIACVLGIVGINAIIPKRTDDPSPPPVRTHEDPSPTYVEPKPEGPPAYAERYIHSEIASFATSWQSGTGLVDNVNRVIVQGKNAKGTLVNQLIFYSDNGNLRLLKQFIVRRDPTGMIIGVQRFVPGGGSAAEYKDGRNVAPAGDVLQQTTFYKFDSYARLQRVEVDTPFVKNVDGLTFDRSTGSLYVTRDRSPGQFSINANTAWLDKFDLWDEFGQDN